MDRSARREQELCVSEDRLLRSPYVSGLLLEVVARAAEKEIDRLATAGADVPNTLKVCEGSHTELSQSDVNT